MKTVLNKTVLPALLGAILFYFLFAYHLERTQWIKLLLLYSGLFVMSYYLFKKCSHDIKTLSYIAFAFRAVFILAIPNLSQDFYRFIWDGNMILEGLNPYLYTPVFFVENGTLPFDNAQLLMDGMGNLSARNFTNYPPINQLLFSLAATCYGQNLIGSVLIMRIVIIAADFGILYFGKKLLKALQLPQKNIFWYLLNPFIIIELTGNLHFEGVMLFFLIWSMYLLYRGKWLWAAIVFALSIATKLIPLLLLPIFWQWFTKKDGKPWLHIRRLLVFYGVTTLVTMVLFLPFVSLTFISNYSETVALWFNNFEFNASLYYLARAIGYSFRGYNEIKIIGAYIPFIVIAVVLLITFLRKNTTMAQLITAMMFALTLYFFLSTTVHPWYIASLVLLSIFTKYRFPLVWSMAIILSYLAYISPNNQENLWIIGLEYLIVYGVFIWEVITRKAAPVSA